LSLYKKRDRFPKDRSPIGSILFPCLSGLSACRNPQDLLALDALLLETTELYHPFRFSSAQVTKKILSGQELFTKTVTDAANASAGFEWRGTKRGQNVSGRMLEHGVGHVWGMNCALSAT